MRPYVEGLTALCSDRKSTHCHSRRQSEVPMWPRSLQKDSSVLVYNVQEVLSRPVSTVSLERMFPNSQFKQEIPSPVVAGLRL